MAAPVYTGGAPFIKPYIRTKARIVPSASATVTLVPSQSNGIYLFDRAGGTSYTLPVAKVGLTYTFYVTVLQTGGANVVKVNAAPVLTFLTGSVISFSGEQVTPSSTLGPYIHNSPVASTFVQLTTNATTTGGGVGSWFTFTCMTATTWFVTGVNHSPSGNLATPFSV